MVHHFKLCKVFLFSVEYKIEFYCWHLKLVLELFQFGIRLILFVCMVEQTLETELLNSFDYLCHTLVSCHNRGITCLKLNHSLNLFSQWLFVPTLKLLLI